jgi:hypothetical protein
MKTYWWASAALAAVTLVGACSIQRAETASTAQKQMVGMSRERVLACMGVPAARQVEGGTEVWSYSSGGRTDTFTAGTSTTTASAMGMGQTQYLGNMAYSSGLATGSATTNSFGSSSTRARYCLVNVVMVGGQVSAVNYSGPTGGLLTQGEQCAYAVQNCVQ